MSSSGHAAKFGLADSGDEGSVPETNTATSDDEMDWEEIHVQAPTHNHAQELADYEEFHAQNELNEAGPSHVDTRKKETTHDNEPGDIEITITRRKTVDEYRKKQAELNAERRALRLRCHKIHTVALLANALVRNKWINDETLHARLLSMTPIALQEAFTNITKKRYPEAVKRGRLFETALMRLTQWWYEDFFEVRNYGHIKSRTFDEVQKELQEDSELDDDDDAEVIRSEKSLMKHALMRKGSRDVSSQLFTALCRALDLPSRLVVSLQSVPWQASVGKPKSSTTKGSRNGKEKRPELMTEVEADREYVSDAGGSDADMEEVSVPSHSDVKGKGKAIFPGDGQTLYGLNSSSSSKGKGKERTLSKPIIKLRKARRGKKLGRKATPPPPVGGFPPVFWAEVFSRADGRWMPVDPTRNITNKRRIFEPPSHDRDNRMVYVVAVEEDSYARDVTARYARDYGSKTSKAQLGGKGRQLWWERIMNLVARPYRLQRDDVEDEEFEFNKVTEAMPTSVNGFKNHPVYMLEQHLKRDEVIFPRKEIGKFRGESVFPRSNVIPLKTAENWMRIGRSVKEGSQPMKLVKQRAATINKRRAMEAAQQEGEEMLQGLYSQTQTEMYIPDPVIDGKIPKNDFGNIDLYTPSMLPAGAVHIPYKGAAKTAKKLGFDYAEAVTNFEFKKGRAFPVVEGIVIAEENEETMLEAYWESERDAAEKEKVKRRERVLKRWTKLVNGLRIYYRLKEQYAKPTGASEFRATDYSLQEEPLHEEALPGGFLTDADSIVQPFHLPSYQHGTYEPFNTAKSGLSRADPDPNAGTAVERGELSDKLHVGPFGSAPPDQIGSFTLTSNGRVNVNESSNGHMDEQGDAEMESDSGADMEEVFPGASGSNSTNGGERADAKSGMVSESGGSGTVKSTPGGMPKSMLELAEEHMRNSPNVESAAEQTDKDVAQKVRLDTPKSSRRATRSKATTTKSTPSRLKKSSRASERKSGKRKRDVSPQSASPISSDLDEDDDHINDVSEEDDDEAVSVRSQQARSRAKSKGRPRTLKAPQTPAPSTRVLRTRVPRNPEKQRAEEEAEAEVREAIGE